MPKARTPPLCVRHALPGGADESRDDVDETAAGTPSRTHAAAGSWPSAYAAAFLGTLLLGVLALVFFLAEWFAAGCLALYSTLGALTLARLLWVSCSPPRADSCSSDGRAPRNEQLQCVRAVRTLARARCEGWCALTTPCVGRPAADATHPHLGS